MEKWTQGWLAYRPVKEAGNAQLAGSMKLTGFDRKHPVVQNAVSEFCRGIKGMLGISAVLVCSGEPGKGVSVERRQEIPAEGYHMQETGGVVNLYASDEAGVLYGIVHILRLIAMEEALAGIDVACRPDNPLRMYDHWDNLVSKKEIVME